MRVRSASCRPSFRATRDRARLRHRACPSSTAIREQLIQARAQHRAQRRAGAGRRSRRRRARSGCARASRAASRSRKQRYRLALRLHVEDNGPGVPERSARPDLLSARVGPRRRQRARASRSRRRSSQQHHGTIECESAPGQHRFHDPAAAGMTAPATRHGRHDARLRSRAAAAPTIEADLDRRRRPIDPLGAREGARARGHSRTQTFATAHEVLQALDDRASRRCWSPTSACRAARASSCSTR